MPVPLDQALRDHPLLAIPALFGAGLVTSLTPCVYPMIPITAGLLGGAGAAGRSRSRTMLYSVLYALGLSLVYASLGLLAGLTGSIFGTVSSNPWAYFIMNSAISAAKTSKAPIALLVKDGDFYKTVSIAYSGGLRYPKLERIDGVEDRLTPLLTARP